MLVRLTLVVPLLLATLVAVRPAGGDEPGRSPEAAALPPDLALVPANAVAFGHVRLADLWKHDGMAQVRRVFEKAGPRALAALDEQFTPAPSSIDRITGVLFLGNPKDKPLMNGLYPAVIAHFNAPFDPAKVRTAHLPKAVSRSAAGKEYFYSEPEGIAVAFPADKIIVFGDEDGVKAVLSAGGDGPNPLAPAVRAAAGKPFTAAVNVKALPIPAEALEQIPDEYRPLAKASLATLTLDVGKQVTADLRIAYPTEADAADAEKALKKAANLGRVTLNQFRQQAEQTLYQPKEKGPQPIGNLPQAVGMVAALGALNTADEILADPPIKREKADLAATVTLPPWMTTYIASSAVAAGALLPAVQKTREAAARAQAMNNMKQIALAMHNYHDTYGNLPPAAICDKKGKKLLSWRVAILPFIEQQNLYQKFKLDEPWDSPNNKQWSGVAVRVYMDPRAPAPAPNMTYYKVFVGNGAMFDWVSGTKFVQVTDGLSNTIMTVAGGDPVPWAKPDDIEFDPDKPLPDLAKPFYGQLLLGMGDGSVRLFDPKAHKEPEKLLKMLITRAGGEVIPEF
jgi:hypothetical protein